MAIDPVMVSIEQTSEATGLGRNKIYALIAAGDLSVVRVGRRVLVPTAEIRALPSRLATRAAS